jgi:hypothetical protein
MSLRSVLCAAGLLALAGAASLPLAAQTPAEACRPSNTYESRTVCVSTNLPGAQAVNEQGAVTLGAQPVAVVVDLQADFLLIQPPLPLSWSVEPIWISLSRGVLVAQFPYHYRIESDPSGAVIVAEADSVGVTPATLVRDEPLTSVVLRKDGYRPQTLMLDSTAAWSQHSASLSALQSAQPLLEVERWSERSTRRGWIDAAALGVAALATAGAIYYKFEANQLYREYERTGDPSLRPRVRRLDTRSGIALAAGQVGLGVFAVRLVMR